MKKAIVISIALVLTLFLLPSCAAGVPQEEYDKVSSELNTAQAQIQSLQAEKQALQDKIDEGKARIEVLNAIFIPAITGEFDAMTQTEAMNYFLEWRDKVIAIGDSTLAAKFQAIIDTGSGEATTSFFLCVLESISKALE